jgi:hypothetical protein
MVAASPDPATSVPVCLKKSRREDRGLGDDEEAFCIMAACSYGAIEK